MPTKNDATSTPTTVKFGNANYSIPPAEDWDIDVLEAIDDQRMTSALKALLGAEQYAEFRTRHTKVRELSEFFEAATSAVNAGN